MIETKLYTFNKYFGLLIASHQLSLPLRRSLKSCFSGKAQTLSSAREDLVEDKGCQNRCCDVSRLDAVSQKSDKELKVSVIICGRNKVPLAGTVLNSSQMRIQISQCLQVNLSSTSGVQKPSHFQHVSAASQFCLNMSNHSSNLLNKRNCGRTPIRHYHMLHISTSSSLSSLLLHKYLITCRPHVLVSFFSFSAQTFLCTLGKSSIGTSDVTLRKVDYVSKKAFSNGEITDVDYSEHTAKGDYCDSHEAFSLDSSCVNQDSNADMSNEQYNDKSKEITQLNHVLNDNNDESHNVYAELYFNLMNGDNVKLKNVSSDLFGEETAQTFDDYAQMYSRITKSDGKDREVSEVRLTHIDTDGKAVMVDVGDKTTTLREARAEGRIYLGLEAARLVKDNKMKKGDVLTVAQIAGITAAKQTAQLIPLCHNINLTKVDVACVLNENSDSVDITSLVRTIGVTGVEMEALTAVSIAALTVYDMCKAVTHDMVISDVRLISKSGGKRDFQR